MSQLLTDFEAARNEVINDLRGTCYCPGPTCSGCEDMSTELFKKGANWAQKWVSEKGIGSLERWMKSVEDKRSNKLEGVIRFCAGLISTMDGFTEDHPQDVEQLIYDEYEKSISQS